MRSKSTTKIEMLGVCKLREVLTWTGRVKPNIKDNDKDPSWDGELIVHPEENTDSKENIRKIPVQVKSSFVKEFEKTATFDPEVIDLENYRNDNGVLYFVVHIKDPDNFRIYYKSLLPLDLDRLIKEAKGQQTKRIHLKKFPHRDLDEMLIILENFIIHKERQGILSQKALSYQELSMIDNANIDNFMIPIPEKAIEQQRSLFSYLFNADQYLYAKYKDPDISIALDKIEIMSIAQQFKYPVIIDDEILYDNIVIVTEADMSTTLKIGQGITMIIDPQKKSKTIEIKIQYIGTLKEQIKQMKFLFALQEQKMVSVGSIVFKGELISHKTNQNDYAARLRWLNEVDETLHKLNVSKTLDLSVCTADDFVKLQLLIDAILYERPVVLKKVESGWAYFAIGNINILLLSFQSAESKELFYLFNLSKLDEITLYADSDSESYPCSPYLALSENELNKIDNIDFANIVKSIKSYEYSEISGQIIVEFILELLKCYDSQQNPNKPFLEIAEELIDYLSHNKKDNKLICIINKLQIVKRKRALTKDEIKTLVEIKQNEEIRLKLAASILLGHFEEAEIYYDKLREEDKSAFDSYPIMNLWGRK